MLDTRHHQVAHQQQLRSQQQPSQRRRRPPTLTESELARRRRFGHFMDVYYSARDAWVLMAEQATAGYEAEMAQFKEQCPPMLFKQYLIDSRGMPR